MLHHHRRGVTGFSWRIAGCLALTAAVALAGCSIWDLGPEPDSYVGAGRNGPRSLTDPTLEAVTPQAHGNQNPQTMVPGATMPFAVPGPTTTGPATQPGADAVPTSAPTTGPASQPAVAVAVPEALSVQDAILVGLQNNVNLRVQRYNVPIQRTAEEQALAAFDPQVSGSLQGGRTQTASTPATTLPFVTPRNSGITDSITGNLQVTEFLPTGTTITAGVTTTNSFYNEAFSSLAPTLTVTQALLRGAGLDVNLAALREAEVTTKISQYELRGLAEQLVATIEEDYWTVAFDERQVAIVENALKVAQEQLDSTNASIRVGRIAATELAAQQAQVESEKGDLINARSALETDRLKLLQLLTPSSRPFWDRSVFLTTYPFIPIGTMDPVDAHVDVALRLSPVINEAKLNLQNGDLKIVVTKNGLLPELDFFVTLGEDTVGNSFGTSITGLDGPNYSAMLGITGKWDPINRAPRAAYHQAELTQDQLRETLDNQAQTIQLGVRSQYIEVQRTRQQIDATRATREADETSLTVEQGKFFQGRSTSLLVAQAQQTLLAAQLSEVQAVTNHLNALVELYRQEGSLLYRRGLDAPGGKPVEGPAWRK